MANYEWNLEKLIKEREEVGKKLKIYTELFDRYTDMIENTDARITLNSKVISVPSGIKLLKKQFYDTIAPNKMDLVIKAMDITKDYQIPFIDFYFSTLPLTNDELIEETRQLFKSLSIKEFLDGFDYYTNPKNQLLHIKYYKKLLTDAYGLSYVDPSKQICYGLIARHNTIEDIITVGHELFHMIIRKKEEPLFNYSEKPTYEETEGYFANLIFCDMLQQRKTNNSSELSWISTIDLQSIIDSITCTFVAKNSISTMDQNGNINYPDLLLNLQQYNINLPINEENINYFISSTLDENINQTVSYLTALDLYHLWQTDPEQAFYYLMRVPTLEGKEPKRDLEQIGVTFFEDGYKNLSDHCKKLLIQQKRKN